MRPIRRTRLPSLPLCSTTTVRHKSSRERRVPADKSLSSMTTRHHRRHRRRRFHSTRRQRECARRGASFNMPHHSLHSTHKSSRPVPTRRLPSRPPAAPCPSPPVSRPFFEHDLGPVLRLSQTPPASGAAASGGCGQHESKEMVDMVVEVLEVRHGSRKRRAKSPLPDRPKRRGKSLNDAFRDLTAALCTTVPRSRAQRVSQRRVCALPAAKPLRLHRLE